MSTAEEWSKRALSRQSSAVLFGASVCLNMLAMVERMDSMLAQLFSASPSGQARQLEARILRGLQNFKESSRITPEVDPYLLRSWFMATTIPDAGSNVDDYLDSLFQRVVPNAVQTQSPRFAGHMTSALPTFVEPLARIITVLNQNVVKLETSGAFTFLERQVVAMLHRLVFNRSDTFYAEHAQKAESTLGVITSGGTVGNISALWCVRNSRLGPRPGFAGIEAEGLSAAMEAYGYRRAVVVGSSSMHYSFEKAADVLGLGTNSLIRIPARQDGTIDTAALRKQLDISAEQRVCVLALIGLAGSTETGSVDPLDALADVASAYGTHLHVDAAWGGPVLFSRKFRSALAGIERADTVTIDGHKQLYLPMGIGTLLCRDPHLAVAIEKSAQYILRSGSVDLGRRTLEGSRPAKALHLHAALNILGRSGYEQLIEDGMHKARQLAASIDDSVAFELLGDPQLNIIVYRYIPRRHRNALREKRAFTELQTTEINRVNELLQARQFHEGKAFASRAVLSHTRHGSSPPVTCLRLVIANPLTGLEHFDVILADQIRLGELIELEIGAAS